MPFDDNTSTRPPRTCETEGCGRTVLARGWCGRCYQRVRKRGLPPLDAAESFARRSRASRAGIAKPGAKDRRAAVMASPETRARHAEAIRAAYARPGAIERRSESARAAHARPDVRERHAAAMAHPETRARIAAAHAVPESKARRSGSIRTALARPETRAKLAAANACPEIRERRAASIRTANARPETKERRGAASRAASERPGAADRRRTAALAVLARPGVKEQRAATLCAGRANPEIAERRIAGIRAAHARPESRARYAAARKRGVYKDTSIELALQRALTEAGIPFEKQKNLLGTPDLFVEPNICIFADGDYWHRRPGAPERDAAVTAALRADGYTVLRFWEHDIHEAVERCLSTIRLASLMRSGHK